VVARALLADSQLVANVLEWFFICCNVFAQVFKVVARWLSLYFALMVAPIYPE